MKRLALALFVIICFAAGAAAGQLNVASDALDPLQRAVDANDSAAVTALISSGADVNSSNRYGITPLFLAARNGSVQILETLLKAGANPNTRQRGGDTVLMVASRSGAVPSVKALLQHRADVNARDDRGQSAVMWAAAEGHAAILELLIAAGADFRTPLDSGFTPLLFAAREGRKDAVEVLLHAGADPTEATRPKRRAARGPQAGMTPLLMAVENGHFDLALRLVEAGADPDDQRAGYAALHNITWVRKPNHGEDEDGMPPPAGSGRVNSLDFVRKLVERGADVNVRIAKASGGRGVLNRTGATPFLLAAKTADLPLLKLLLELGADPSIATKEGVTPLIAAAGIGTLAAGEVAGTEDEVLEVLNWLIENGADVNAVDQNGESSMHAAAYKNLPRVIELLAMKGARIDVWNKANKYGWTPLLIAEGFRPGNFKPSFETIASIHKVMQASGVPPPPPTKADGVNNSDFGPADRKYPVSPTVQASVQP